MATDTRSRRDGLTGPQKCAVLCIAMGPAAAAKILQQLGADEVERVTREIAAMPSPDPELVRTVIEEYQQAAKRPAPPAHGGPGYAAQVLEQAIGASRARPILDRLHQGANSGLGRLRQAAPETLTGLLRDEHPQTLALVLSHLDDDQSLALLRSLEPERAQDALWRVARLGPVSEDTLALVERTLMAQIAPRPSAPRGGEGGPERVARLLNLGGETLEKPVLEAMDRHDAEIATRVRNLMFTFEDLLRVDARGMQRVLREVEGKELAMALKVSSDELKKHIRKGMSERAAGALDEEMEMLGPVRVKDVEAAHARIIETVRSLAQAGEVTIAGQGGDDAVV